MKPVLLAVDLGTESVRAALVSSEGRIVGSARRDYPMATPQPGWAEQDPLRWWDAAAAAIRDVLDRAPGQEIAGVGVCGQMHGPVPVAADGSVLAGPVQLWCDKRAAPFAAAVANRADGGTLSALAGNPPTPAWMGFKIAWEQHYRPSRHARVWKYLPPKDYLNFRLTGVAATDYSEASGSFVMDAIRRTWSPALADALSIDLKVLPDIHGPHDVVGVVTAEAAACTGLRAGVPVVTGGGDMLCLLLGAAITRPGRACDTTGTASVLSVFAPQPIADARVMNLHHVVPGWIAFGICDSGGGSLHWLSEVAGGTYGDLDRLAGAVPPGADGLFFFPYLQGQRTLGPAHARGVLFGLTPGHGRGALARAIMEGVTLDLRRALEVITASGLQVHEMRTIGGGARSAVWSSIKADVYRAPVRTFAEFEGGIVGAAILAGTGVGIFADAAGAAERLTVLGTETQPDAERIVRYQRHYAIFARLHDLLLPGFDLLAEPGRATGEPVAVRE